jgi:AcrR family transcriptional regulator
MKVHNSRLYLYVLFSKTRPGPRQEAILEAMIRVAGSKGYGSATVADVVAEAGASRATFYKYFGDKLDCFLAAFELAAERILGAAAAGCGSGQPWRERARRGLTAVVELLVADPALAGAAVVEAATAGAEARRRYWAAIARLARLLEDDGPTPHRVELPASTGLMAVAAVAGLIFDELRDGRVAELPGLLPELEFALLVPYLGPRAAADPSGATAASPSR